MHDENEGSGVGSARRLVGCEGAISAKIQEEIVLLDSATGTYFALNEIGAMLFEHINEPRALVDLARLVECRFDVSYERSLRDVTNFASELVSRGFAKWVQCEETPR